MAIDSIARAMAASGGGGGEGSIEDIISGDGISVTGGSTKTITNVGVRSISTSAKDGAISVNTGGTSRDVTISGLIGRRSSNGGEIFNAASMARTNAHAEGNTTEASGKNSHAEGNTTISSGMNSHAEGNYTEASGLNSHAGGLYTLALGDNQTVIGKYNAADRNKAFIIGGGTSDSGKNIATVDWDGNVVLDGTVTAKDADGNEVVLNGVDAYTKAETDILLSDKASKEELEEIKLFKFPNATIIGQPIINNGQVSGFSSDNYMRFPFIVNMQGRPFVIEMAFTTGSNVTDQQNILDGMDHGLAFAVRSGKFVLVMSSVSGQWDITGGEKISAVTVSANTTYRTKLSWDGSVYKFEYSTDGETYVEDTNMRVASSLSLYPTQINIGVTAGLQGIFTGIINMNYCSLTISDKVVWTGMDDVGLATRMAIDMSNIDEAGKAKVVEIVQPELDKKTDKIVIETITSDANVVTVPENVKDFGMISMIGGKTVKRSNIWDEQYAVGNYTADGEPNASLLHIRNRYPIPVKPNAAYTIVTTSSTYRTVFWTKDMQLVSTTGGLTNSVFVVPENAYFMGFNMDSVYGGAYKNDIAIYEGEIENAVYGMERLDNAPVEKIVSTNVIESNFGVLTKLSSRYGYDFDNLKSGEYEITITNSSSKALSIDIYHNGAFSGNAKIVDANKTKTEVFNVTDGDSIVVYCGSGVTVNPISFISVSIGGKPFVKEIFLLNLLNLPDYGCSAGDVYNYVDFENMVYHHRVGNIAMKDHLPSSWSYIEASKRYVSDYWASTINLKIPQTSSTLVSIVTNNYFVSEWTSVADISKDKTIYISTSGGICVRNLAATTSEQLNTLLQDTVLNYELAEEELIPIPDIFTILPVEANSTIEFVNEHNLPVPNTVKYQKGAE